MRLVWPAAGVLLAAAAFACDGGGGADVTVSPRPSAEPSPTSAPSPSPSLPARPADFDDYPAVIAEYLTAVGGSPDCLAALLMAWEAVEDGTAPCAAADLDGDGEDEYVVRLVREAEAPASPQGLEGTVVVFDLQDGAYAAAFRLEELAGAGGEPAFPMAEGRIPDPAIFEVGDVNGDGKAEAAVTSSQCGAHTCTVTLCLLAVSEGAYASVIVSDNGCLAAPEADDQVRLEDVDGDGTLELMFREGLVGSVGAGPQRESIKTYGWDGSRYALTGSEDAPSDLRYFKVRDADDALAAGDYASAVALYQEAADSAALEDIDYAGDPAELRAYARFRVGLVKALQGDANGALTALDAAVAADPGALHSQLAAQFRQAYQKVKHVSAGCSAARDFVEGNEAAFAALWDYGYANPAFSAQALCPS